MSQNNICLSASRQKSTTDSSVRILRGIYIAGQRNDDGCNLYGWFGADEIMNYLGLEHETFGQIIPLKCLRFF